MDRKRASFRDIKEEMLRRIADRTWRAGALIPGEAALAEEFGAARATVNRALQDLARGGIVERKRKAGTRVALHPVREARFVIPLVRQEVEGAGASYGYELRSRTVTLPPPDVARRLGVADDANMLHLTCLHRANGRPFQAEDRWINPQAVPGVLEVDFAEIGPNEWLVANAPFSRAEFAFLAEAAQADIAGMLEVDAGVAVLVGERLTWLRERAITLVRMAYRPGYRIASEL